MKILNAVALAVAVAMGVISAGPQEAGAAGKRYHHHRYYQPPPYDPGPGIVAGAVVGLTLGALAAPAFYPPYYGYYPPPPLPYTAASGNPHMDWCQATYDTYDPETNIWIDYWGVPHQCIGPY